MYMNSCSPLPSDGIILRPCPKDSEGDQGSTAEGMGVGVSSSMLGGASIHDESFEDEFSDMEGSESITDGNTGIHVTLITVCINYCTCTIVIV